MTNDAARLTAVLEKAVEMRNLQKLYFKDRDRSLLDQCRKAETEFDRLAKDALKPDLFDRM